MESFRKIGCEVVGASIDSEFVHLAWSQVPRKEGGIGKLNIPLIADVDRSLAQKYGALLGTTGFTLRATYVIDPKGVVRHLSLTDAPVGRNVQDVLRIGIISFQSPLIVLISVSVGVPVPREARRGLPRQLDRGRRHRTSFGPFNSDLSNCFVDQGRPREEARVLQ